MIRMLYKEGSRQTLPCPIFSAPVIPTERRAWRDLRTRYLKSGYDSVGGNLVWRMANGHPYGDGVMFEGTELELGRESQEPLLLGAAVS